MRTSLFFLFLLTTIPIVAQDPIFTAEVSSDRVAQHSVFEVRFELRNAAGDDFIPPDFRDFEIVGGPSFGSSTMIVNGEVSRSQSWSYSLLAKKAGQFTINAATVIAGRRKLASRPVSIHVMAAKDLAASDNAASDAPVKLIAYVEPGDYYPGQQIILQYKLLFNDNVQTVNTIAEDDYADFFIQNFNSFSKVATYEPINGVRYASRIIKAVALFAHQSGTYTIDPMVMDVGISAPYPGNQGFFTMRRLKGIQVASDPLSINILPLPPVPTGYVFSGAVGQYSIKTLSVGSTRISTDQDFNMKVEFTGNGDARRWDPPSVVAGTIFEIFDPGIAVDNLRDSEGGVVHSRIIDYVLLPKQPGDYEVSVHFTYFNPATKKYESISTDTIRIHVTQGHQLTANRSAATPSSQNPMPLRKVNNITSDDRFWLSLPHLVLFGLLLSGTCWGFWTSYKQRHEASIPESERRRSVALRSARLKLDSLNKSSDQVSDKEFFEKVTEVYWKFLSEKFNIPPADLDYSTVSAHFSKTNISSETIEKALAFFNQGLSIRYGGLPPRFSKEQSSRECMEIMEALDDATRHHI